MIDVLAPSCKGCRQLLRLVQAAPTYAVAGTLTAITGPHEHSLHVFLFICMRNHANSMKLATTSLDESQQDLTQDLYLRQNMCLMTE